MEHHVQNIAKQLWADPMLSANGANPQLAHEEYITSLLACGEISSAAHPDWACLPDVVEGLLELREISLEQYNNFFEHIPHDLGTAHGIAALVSLVRALGDDHYYTMVKTSDGLMGIAHIQDERSQKLARPVDALYAIHQRLAEVLPYPEEIAVN